MFLYLINIITFICFLLSFSPPALAGKKGAIVSPCSSIFTKMNVDLSELRDSLGRRILAEDGQISLVVMQERMESAANRVVDETQSIQLNAGLVAEGGPKLASAIKKLKKHGGKILTGSQDDFIVSKKGQPIIRLNNLKSLDHEMEHFETWLELKQGIVDSGVASDDEASLIAIGTMLTPLGNLYTESRAVLLDLPERGQDLSISNFTYLLHSHSYPYISALDKAFRMRGFLTGLENSTDNAVMIATIDDDVEEISSRLVKQLLEYREDMHNDLSTRLMGFSQDFIKSRFIDWARENGPEGDIGKMSEPLIYFYYSTNLNDESMIETILSHPFLTESENRILIENTINEAFSRTLL